MVRDISENSESMIKNSESFPVNCNFVWIVRELLVKWETRRAAPEFRASSAKYSSLFSQERLHQVREKSVRVGEFLCLNMREPYLS